MAVGHEPALCPQPRKQPYAGLHQKKHGQQGEGGDPASLVHSQGYTNCSLAEYRAPVNQKDEIMPSWNNCVAAAEDHLQQMLTNNTVDNVVGRDLTELLWVHGSFQPLNNMTWTCCPTQKRVKTECNK